MRYPEITCQFGNDTLTVVLGGVCRYATAALLICACWVYEHTRRYFVYPNRNPNPIPNVDSQRN